MCIQRKLYNYTCIPEDIQKKNRELNGILMCKEESSNTLKAATLSDEPRGTDITDQVYNAVERIIIRYDIRIEQITEEILHLLDEQQYITKALYNTDQQNELTQEERRVIDLRYFRQYKWDYIARIMKYSISQCQRYEKTAVQKIENEYNKISVAA